MTKEVSWDNAPEYGYKGYVYMPHIEEVCDKEANVIGKRVWHDIYRAYEVQGAQSRAGICKPAMSTNKHPERFFTKKEFRDFVDFMERVQE